ncbi:hypothetical protein CHS0354_013900 [Potamilus streckersoni]|uniref:Uncharacterized protein n=1 Tax=Potamilus streckersoni TaxID=2493646 RepID=A0AAE0RWN3_9BIVA|nr:hypothetical protein CHS0354_013900 [Potamilus streckersoni]
MHVLAMPFSDIPEPPYNSFTDPDMSTFTEQMVQGGISVISITYDSANHKHMKHYNPTKPPVYILNLDEKQL